MSKVVEKKKADYHAGSPGIDEPAFLVVGKLHHPHGLRGEISMEIVTDFPERLQPGATLFLGETKQPLEILSRRRHRKALLVSFDGYTNPESAIELCNQWVYVTMQDRPRLPEGEYYYHQILGLRIINDEGVELGKLSGILETGANDVYIVQTPEGREILLPAIKPVILDIDVEHGKMLVHLLPGLWDG